MTTRPYAIDHVVIAVRSLDMAASIFQDLGFVVTPRSDHPFGSANRLIVLPDLYIELITIVRPGLLPQYGFARFVADMLAADQTGPIMIALRARDIESARTHLQRLGFAVPEPTRFQRESTLPDGRVTTLMFEVFLLNLSSDTLAVLYCRHLTPQYIWHPTVLSHPNGATKLTAMTLTDPGGIAWRQLGMVSGATVEQTISIQDVKIRTGPHALTFTARESQTTTLDTMTIALRPREWT